MPRRTKGPVAGVTPGSPSDRLDDESGAVVHRRTRHLTIATTVAAHLVGTGVVVVLLVFVLPVPPEFQAWSPVSVQLVWRNLVAAIAYVGLIVPAGVALGLKQADPATRWLLEERAPTERERELALGLGLRLLRMQTGLWAGGVVLFYLLNVSTSGLLAFEIAITVALGGVTTAAVAYLLTERNTRSTIARALAGALPRSYRVPGVATRALFAWALGTAIPLIGVVAIAAVSLALPVSAHRVAATALCLGVIALVVRGPSWRGTSVLPTASSTQSSATRLTKRRGWPSWPRTTRADRSVRDDRGACRHRRVRPLAAGRGGPPTGSDTIDAARHARGERGRGRLIARRASASSASTAEPPAPPATRRRSDSLTWTGVGIDRRSGVRLIPGALGSRERVTLRPRAASDSRGVRRRGRRAPTPHRARPRRDRNPTTGFAQGSRARRHDPG